MSFVVDPYLFVHKKRQRIRYEDQFSHVADRTNHHFVLQNDRTYLGDIGVWHSLLLTGACGRFLWAALSIARRAQRKARMASVLQRSVKLSVAARPAVAVGAQQQISVRGFAASKGKKKQTTKKGSKKGGEDANFELMLRNVKGRYPEAYV